MFSDLFNTIFVHIPKTGGRSVEDVFLHMHGLNWRTRDPLLLRKRGQSEKGPRRLAHLYAGEYVEFGYLSRSTFASCFKFSTVRNPYDRLLSLYRYRTKSRPMPYRDFVELATRSDHDRDVVPQANFVLDSTRGIAVDRIVRFES